MAPLSSVLAAASLIIQVVLLITVLRGRPRHDRWIAALILASAVATGSYLLPPELARATGFDRELLFTVALAALLAAGGALLYMLYRARGSTAATWPSAAATAGLPRLAETLSAYTQALANASTLDEVISAATDTLKETLGVQAGRLLLINDTGKAPDSVELLVIEPDGGQRTGDMGLESPIYRTFSADQRALTQHEIDHGSAHRAVPAGEADFFRGLEMQAYAPIITDDFLIGILACGPKADGSVPDADELVALQLMAQQVGVTLRNARLIDDLRHLSSSMQSLNHNLAQAREDLVKLDAVKTDFVTIASHELRTPLAQIRGYSDIMEELNGKGMLDQVYARTLIANLQKASGRIEELIAAMLDVSQLDVNAMDLRFMETSVESAVKLAIEPLADAMNQRRISLAARGLRGLPSIQADMQRLVQALGNIIVNAIKFTPDGGRIEITGYLQAPQEEGESQQILLAITDTGIGIPPNDINLIFNKFYRGHDPSLNHSTGAYKFMGAGPGLGLTIAKGIIEGHGGKIWAESPGRDMQNYPGTSFYLLLPLSPPEGARRVMPIKHQAAG